MAALPDNPSDPVFIRVRDLHKQIGQQQILKGMTLDIPRGSGVAIIGGSGTGKSVFLKLVYSYIANKIQYEQQLSITSSNITSDYECFFK